MRSTVTPAVSDVALRTAATIEDARATVDRMSGGKLAYVYVANTGNEGYDGFVRQYLAQVGKSGVIVDERNNGGGQVADYIIEALRRVPLVQMAPRYGENFALPMDAIYGPRTMMVNEHAGRAATSAVHVQEVRRRQTRRQTNVGRDDRIWLVPQLIDGGTISVPHFPIADPDGLWGMEGEGVHPDVEVELDPKAFAAGCDTQLEAASAHARLSSRRIRRNRSSVRCAHASGQSGCPEGRSFRDPRLRTAQAARSALDRQAWPGGEK